MSRVSLPILTLAVKSQRYSCHGCGNCCRDFTVQLRENDLASLRRQDWEARLGEPVTITFRGVEYLRQRSDGSCIFLLSDGRCRIHAEFGFEAKPIACQLFPFSLMPSTRGPRMGLNFACQSVLENKGAELVSHQPDLKRLLAEIPESQNPAAPAKLTDHLRASEDEERSLIVHIDDWLKRPEIRLHLRLDGLAWVAHSLAHAEMHNVRDERFNELLDVLFAALPGELEFHPLTPPTSRQLKMLRGAVFARTEDPKLDRIGRQGRLRMTISQLLRQRRWARGRGQAPQVAHDWSDHVELAAVEAIGPSNDSDDVAAIDDLITRWLRATILGGRAWGAGSYGWPMVRGLQAMLLNVAAVGFLARLHAAGGNRITINLDDVRAAVGRVDRAAGRAPWLGSAGERLRLDFLQRDEGLRRILNQYAPTDDSR